MNPSTALARVVVDELIRSGVRDAVLAPGSRSAPFAIALQRADAAGRLRLHARIDERTAAFLALGLARGSGRVVPVVCTSGTAVANLHPAVLEAHHDGVPLLALTPDRPPELRGAGANQTIDQTTVFGDAVRLRHDLGVAERRPGQNAYWRTITTRCVAAAADPVAPGPVQLNVPLREPLLPDTDEDWCEPLDGRPAGAPWTTVHAPARERSTLRVDAGERGLVVVAVGEPVPEWLPGLGWPVVAETGGAGVRGALPGGGWLLGDDGFMAAHRPSRVVCVGRPTLHRGVSRLLADPGVRVELIDRHRSWPSPGNSIHTVHCGPVDGPVAVGRGDQRWLAEWVTADRLVREVLEGEGDRLTGLRVARDVVAAMPRDGLLVIASSQPIRDVGLAAPPRGDLRVIANRGVAGIDGTVSTAIGVALAAAPRPAYLLTGDLAFLHDATALVIGPAEPRPDLTVVVVNNDGGGIFALLEPGRLPPDVFERVFGTPHHADLGALCAGTGTPHRRLSTVYELAAALAPEPGVRVVEVTVDRGGDRHRQRALQARIRAALG